jgi:hypothetical protein
VLDHHALVEDHTVPQVVAGVLLGPVFGGVIFLLSH